MILKPFATAAERRNPQSDRAGREHLSSRRARQPRSRDSRKAEIPKFGAPETVFAEAREHLPSILKKRGVDPQPAMMVLDVLRYLIGSIEEDIYRPFEAAARQRLRNRDEDDWPVLATALALNCPIWTEDADFFGSGVATWTTDRIELLLRDLHGSGPSGPSSHP